MPQIVDNDDVGELKREFFRNVKNGEGIGLALAVARIPAVNGVGRGIEARLPIAQDIVGFGMRNGANDAARRAVAKLENGKITDEILEDYMVFGSEKYNAMVEEIRKELKLTSLKFQKLEALIKAIGMPPEKVCTYCWNGRDVNQETPEFD